MKSSPERIIDKLKPTKHNRNKYQQNTTFRNDLWVKVKNSMKENTWESILDTNEPNPYKPLEEEVLEDADEKKSITLDETQRISNMSELTNKGKNDSQEYHIDYVTIEKLTDMIKAVFTDDKAELKCINRLSTDITTKLVLASNDSLENLNLMLGKRVLSLE